MWAVWPWPPYSTGAELEQCAPWSLKHGSSYIISSDEKTDSLSSACVGTGV